MSLILVSDTTDEIVAVRVNKISKNHEHTNETLYEHKEQKNGVYNEDKTHNDDGPVSEGRKKLEQLGEANKSRINVYERYKVYEVIEFMALAVHKDFRQRGIGLEIVNATLVLIKYLDFGGVIVKGEGSENYVIKYLKRQVSIFSVRLYTRTS